LRTDRIDLYQVHWPDPLVPFDDETRREIDRILLATITDPVGPELLAPPAREVAAPPAHPCRVPAVKSVAKRLSHSCRKEAAVQPGHRRKPSQE